MNKIFSSATEGKVQVEKGYVTKPRQAKTSYDPDSRRPKMASGKTFNMATEPPTKGAQQYQHRPRTPTRHGNKTP